MNSKDSTKHFREIEDVKLNDLVDAMDIKGKWFKGFICDEKVDPKTKEVSKKVHFFNFESKWDEWYGNSNIEKLAPYLTYCEESEEMYF